MRLSWLENNDNLQANLFTLVIHLALFIFMIFSVNWQVKTPYYAEVELWDAIPTQIKPKPLIKRATPKVQKPQPSIAEKIVEAKKDADIQLKKKKAAELKKKKAAELKKKKAAELKKIEQLKKKALEEEKLAELQKRLLEDEEVEKVQKKLLEQDDLERLQEELRNKDLAKETRIAIEGTQDLVAGTNSGELEKYKALIQQKIYQNVNKQLCGLDPLELIFEIVLMPTGDLIGGAKMIKSSKIESCDQAVERAILQAQPLPMPQDNRLFAQLKKLKLKFQPNGPIN
ncbi:translocation protein TolB precursor [Methylophilales bacterium HTCC2181]|uniref:Translocation protein TolB n=1 Tax=Methylophilales bacterium HTCC2181 TaxID=383631 RepID=A0P5D8_9PROT|nr:translocation protein TolB precursor [Methylophilales bacterium HTCC2181]